MTKKLNHLISSLVKKHPKIIACTNCGCGQMMVDEQKPFESAFLEQESLKDKVDRLGKDSTPEDLKIVKDEIARIIRDSSNFGKKSKIKHLKELQNVARPERLQFFFYNYILAAEGKRVSNLQKTKKIAQVLIEIADDLDRSGDQELASEADALLQELIKDAQAYTPTEERKDFAKGISDAFKGSGSQMMGEQSCQPDCACEKCMGPSGMMMAAPMDEPTTVVVVDEMDEPGEKLMEDIEVLDSAEPEIEEVLEPEQEYDMVGLEDIKERIEGMKWRIADKKSKVALEEAIEHIEKAMEYHKAKGSRVDKVHKIFDDAGLALRLKDFE